MDLKAFSRHEIGIAMILLNVPGGTKSAVMCAPRYLSAAILAFAVLTCSVDAHAQDWHVSGTAWVTDWPEANLDELNGESVLSRDYSSYNLLPFIDSLAVDYRFSADSLTSEFLSMHFSVEWFPGDGGIVGGERVGRDRMPPGIVIESIDLLMTVLVDNEPVAEFFLPLDTIGLGPSPSVTFVDVSDVVWESVFANTDEAAMRRIAETGFRFSAVRIPHIVFAQKNTRADEAVSEGMANPYYEPTDVTVFIPDEAIWVFWQPGRSAWAPPAVAVRRGDRERPRESGRTPQVEREVEGRAGVERGGERAGTTGAETGAKEPDSEGGIDLGDLLSSSGDDDDDDEDRLIVAAVAGVVIVGGLAIFGGTIGYFGSAEKAPIGLMSGYVEPKGGILLQVAINKQVFGSASGSENLITTLTGFYDAFKFPIQPAFGGGVRFTEEDTEGIAIKPSISVGVVGNFGKLVLLAAYDIATPDFRFGIGVNFRHKN